MAKNMTTNKELIKDEVKYMLSNLRNSIAYGGRDTCVVYLANVRKETIATIEGMGIKHEQAGRALRLTRPFSMALRCSKKPRLTKKPR